MPAQNKTLIDAGLKKAGFGGLGDPRLFEQIAAVICQQGERVMHHRFRSMLLAAEPDKRKLAYDSIAPKLRYRALPLETYIQIGREEAEKKQLPHYDPETLQVTEYKPQEIETSEYRAKKKAAIEEAEPSIGSPLEHQASAAIARSLREENARGQLHLVCRKCTREQTWRGKRRDHMLKIAKQEGWAVTPQEVLCVFCKPRIM